MVEFYHLVEILFIRTNPSLKLLNVLCKLRVLGIKIRAQTVMWFKNELPGRASLAYTYPSYLVLSNNLTVLSFIGFFKV